MSQSRTILLVGHCGPDSWSLKSAVGRAAPGSTIEMVNDQRTLEKLLPSAALVMVNRILDGSFASRSGVELIAGHAAPGGPAFMLISNYAEAHEEAIRAGGVPGFGKSEMYSTRALELLQSALAAAPSS